MELGHVLVLDDSKVMREMLRVLLARHARSIEVAASAAEARARLARDGLDLVLADVHLADGNGLDLLEADARGRRDRRRWILITARPTPELLARAERLGALGTLTKPVAWSAIAACVGRKGCESAETRGVPRTRVAPEAWLMDSSGEARLLRFEIQDLSVRGAFLLTPGPLDVGTPLRLELGVGEERARILARVVRVQEPAWGSTPGVGVCFEAVEDGERPRLETLVVRAGGRSPRTDGGD